VFDGLREAGAGGGRSDLVLRGDFHACAGLHQIHDLKYSTPVTVLVVAGFNIVMLWLLEVPLACFLIAPDWTPTAINRAKAWVSRHAHQFAIRGLTVLGTLLIIKGIIGLVS